jgi:large subunit ribosomal protein L7e
MDIEGKQRVPENVQKKIARDTKITKETQANNAKRAEAKKVAQADASKRAEKYAKLYQEREKHRVDSIRKAKQESSLFVPAEAKVALVVRIRGINCLAPIVRKILQLLRLRQLHNAVLVRLNKATINMLRRVEPYITYGYPSQKTVERLVYKRGFARVNKQRVPIVDNELIADNLGKLGITCVEDLVHELFTVGSNFKKANNFMWYFKLSSPKGGFNNKRHSFQQGGDYGNREELINELVNRML